MVLFWDLNARPREYKESLRQGEQLIGYRTEQVSMALISQTQHEQEELGGLQKQQHGLFMSWV